MKSLAITCGDPAGVGPEIVKQWLQEYPKEAEHSTVYGPSSWLTTLPHCDTVTYVPVGDKDFELTPGSPSEEGAIVALAAMQAAADACSTGDCDAVVTAPVSKAWLQRVGYKFPGQTEFFADCWGGAPTMAFVGEQLRVVLTTWHIPLMDVASTLNEKLIYRAVERAYVLAKAYGAVTPRIAVCGLNPHAGEGGILGTEERDTYDPILDKLRIEFSGVSRCLPADTVFNRMLKGDFDVVVALYHDQGLGPLKTLEFDSAVNVTLGLPWVRTSPDHGTAFDIAGKGVASCFSFRNAVKVAQKLIS